MHTYIHIYICINISMWDRGIHVLTTCLIRQWSEIEFDFVRWQRRHAGLGFKACLKCKNTYELYCFPADRGSPDGRFHYCCACKAEVRRQNNAPVGWVVSPPGGEFWKIYMENAGSLSRQVLRPECPRRLLPGYMKWALFHICTSRRYSALKYAPNVSGT